MSPLIDGEVEKPTCKRMFRTESYTLRHDLLKGALDQMSNPSFSIDLFASVRNSRSSLYCSKANSAFWYHWGLLNEDTELPLWANPPFSKLRLVTTKVALDQSRLVICTPDWKGGIHEEWRSLLDRLTLRRARIPATEGGSTYLSEAGNQLPNPSWDTLVSLIDGGVNQISQEELIAADVEFLTNLNKNFRLTELEQRLSPPSKQEAAVQTICVEDLESAEPAGEKVLRPTETLSPEEPVPTTPAVLPADLPEVSPIKMDVEPFELSSNNPLPSATH